MQENENEVFSVEENEKSSSLPFGEFTSEEKENETPVGDKKSEKPESFTTPTPSQVVIIGEKYENPMEQKVKEYRNSSKQRCLVFSLLGLILSVFYVGLAFTVTSVVMSIPLMKNNKKSSFLKWSTVCNISAIIIEAILIFTRLYFA